MPQKRPIEATSATFGPSAPLVDPLEKNTAVDGLDVQRLVVVSFAGRPCVVIVEWRMTSGWPLDRRVRDVDYRSKE
ncbi:hypothetical protein FIBSPDRAFT_876439 [Athelia psychrophila]|uniref:Uncharacterized protein n=1 Tax=Athelia psychrophila TaxID=1759441 RepID=A0A167WVX9_9AGAM|nr:hypothetical protein FIBSPDRAFT_876439 [Fibularhizoctonia sp. CBS 109695]